MQSGWVEHESGCSCTTVVCVLAQQAIGQGTQAEGQPVHAWQFSEIGGKEGAEDLERKVSALGQEFKTVEVSQRVSHRIIVLITQLGQQIEAIAYVVDTGGDLEQGLFEFTALSSQASFDFSHGKVRADQLLDAFAMQSQAPGLAHESAPGLAAMGGFKCGEKISRRGWQRDSQQGFNFAHGLQAGAGGQVHRHARFLGDSFKNDFRQGGRCHSAQAHQSGGEWRLGPLDMLAPFCSL